MNKPIHYIILIIVLTIGIAGGIFINDQIRIYQANKAIEKITKNLKNTLDRTSKISNLKNIELSKKIEEARGKSKNGKALWRHCVDWDATKEKMPNYITKKGAKEHCDNYWNYIKTGKIRKIDNL
ncbi:hypothetical protein WN093_00460 [Gammaproteobacteria bacterium AS21]